VKRCFIIFLLIFFWIGALATDFQLFQEKGKVGLKNAQGGIVIPPTFEALGWSDGSFSVVGQITGYKLNGSWGLINLKKEFITQAEFESLLFAGADRVVAIKKINSISRKAGSLTVEGEVTIPFMYDAVTLHGMRAIVMNKIGIEYRFGLTDLMNRSILPVDYKNIYPVGPLRFAVENKEGKLALFSDEGRAVTKFFIDSISVFHRSHAVIHSRGWQGLIDREGNVIAETTYSDIKFDDDGSIRALRPSAWKILNDKNIELQSLQAEELHSFSGNHFIISQGGKHGLIDKDLREVWPVSYDYILPMINGLIPVCKKNKWGLVNFDQKEIIPFDYDSLIWDGEFATSMTKVLGKDQWTFINVKQNVKSNKKYDGIEKANSRFFKIKKNGYVGLLSSEGKEVVHCVYDSLLELKEKRLAVLFKGQYGIISTNEDWVLAPQPFPIRLVNEQVYLEGQPQHVFLKSLNGSMIYFTSNPIRVTDNYLEETLPNGINRKIGFDGLQLKLNEPTSVSSEASTNISRAKSETNNLDNNGLRIIQRQGKFGFVDSRGRLVIPNRYDSMKPFSESMAAFKLLGKWGYINLEDKIICNPSFDFAGDFLDGYAIVSKNKKFGLIDKTGTGKLSFSYDSIIRSGNRLLIYLSGKKGVATTEGKILVEARYDFLTPLPNGQLLVGIDNTFGVISEDGLNLVPIIYSSLQYDENKNLYFGHQAATWTTLNTVP
jgi:WG containing repeat